MIKENFYNKVENLDHTNKDTFHEKIHELVESLDDRYAAGYLICFLENDSFENLKATKEMVLKTQDYSIWYSL